MLDLVEGTLPADFYKQHHAQPERLVYTGGMVENGDRDWGGAMQPDQMLSQVASPVSNKRIYPHVTNVYVAQTTCMLHADCRCSGQ